MTNPRLFEDLTELAGGAASMLNSLRQQLREETKERFDSMTARMDLVTRADFERLESMIAKARNLQEDLIARLTALELAVGIESKPEKKAAAPKKASKPAKKATPKKAPAKATKKSAKKVAKAPAKKPAKRK